MAVVHTTRQEHPLPAVLMHWTHVVAMAALILSGLYIHYPFIAGAMGGMRTAHFVFAFVLIATVVVRVYWMFFGAGSAGSGSTRRVPDWTHFAPERANRGQMLETLKYYLFLRSTHPRSGKFNTLQKSTYALWLLLIVAQAVTGFAMWSATRAAFEPLTYMLGGTEMVRVDHYLLMWLFIVTLMIHIYLSVAEAWAQVPIMFLWKPTRTPARAPVGRERA
jgi:Ni/Fe-hydrogenase 1 B-type cytochrome subunit